MVELSSTTRMRAAAIFSCTTSRPPRPEECYHGHVDLLIAGGTVVTCDEAGTVQGADLLIRDGIIAAIGAAARQKVRGVSRTLDAAGCVVMPGIVQAHV